MTFTKDDLNYLRELKAEIDDEEARLVVLYTLLEGLSSRPITDESPSGSDLDRFALFDKIITKQRLINELNKARYETWRRVSNQLRSLPVLEHRVLELRYFENFSWEFISELLGKPVRTLQFQHRKTLKKL